MAAGFSVSATMGVYQCKPTAPAIWDPPWLTTLAGKHCTDEHRYDFEGIRDHILHLHRRSIWLASFITGESTVSFGLATWDPLCT